MRYNTIHHSKLKKKKKRSKEKEEELYGHIISGKYGRAHRKRRHVQ
jgi:hypothetical protein